MAVKVPHQTLAMCALLQQEVHSLMCGKVLTTPDVSNAMQSKNLEDSFGEWPALMEVERSEDSEHSDKCEWSNDATTGSTSSVIYISESRITDICHRYTS